jgi:hypothetical protein
VAANKQPISKGRKILRESFCAFLWLYAIVKLFVFDFDVYLAQSYFPSLSWVVNFKFFFLLVLVSVYWLAVGDKNFFKSIGFLLVYPFFFLLWRIPRLLFKDWVSAVTAMGFLASFLKSIKINFIAFTVFSVGTILGLFAQNEYVLILSIVILISFIVFHFSRRFYSAFSPSKALAFPRDGLIKLLDGARTQFALPQELKSTAIDKFTPEQKNKWATNLQFLLIINRASTFIAAKLKQFQESRIVFLYFLIGLLFSLFLTVVVFGVANLALQRLDPSHFSDHELKGLIFFIYYSFNTLVTNSIADFYPISDFARFLNTAEVFFGILTLVILVLVYTSVKSERTKSEVDSIIVTLNRQGHELEKFINQEFSIDIERAITEIQKLPSNLIKVIYYFTIKQE